MAWLTRESPETFNQTPGEPDMDTLMYWIGRMEPIIRVESNQEVIIVFANRCGSENEATYAGTSAIIGVESGEVRVYGMLGRGESDLLVVDTSNPPFAKLVYRPEGAEAPADTEKDEQFDTKEESPRPKNVVPASVPNYVPSHRVAEQLHDTTSSGNDHEHSRKRNPSYKRNDLTIRLPEKSYRYKPIVGRTNQDLDPVSGHARRRSEIQSKTQWKHQAHSTGLPASDNEFDRSSANSEPPPSALFQAPAGHNYLSTGDRNHSRAQLTSTNNADDIVIAIDIPVVEDQVEQESQPLTTTTWMADDDPELAYIEDEDPDEPFHDPTGKIGRWVQMIQTPRKPPIESQHHQCHSQTDHGNSSRGQIYSASPEKPSLFQHSRPLKAHRVMRDEETQTQRSRSAAPGKQTDFKAVCQKLENMAELEASAAQESSRLDYGSRDKQTRHYAHQQRPASRAKGRSNSHAIREDELMSGSEHSISFAMDDSVLANSNTHTTQNRVPSRIFFSPVEAEPPVLRLTSSNRLKVDRGTEETDIDRDQSELSSRRHQQAQKTDPLDIPRTHSRGRQLETNKDRRKEHGSTQYQKHPNTSESRRQVSKEPADLTQYHLIEDALSASCPIQGSRSRSRARNQSSLGQKSSQTQLRSARDASRPRLQDDLGRFTSAQLKTRSKMSAPRPERGWAAQDIRDDMSVSATFGHERSRQGSKTPVPMILVSK